MRERLQATVGAWTDVHAYFARTYDALNQQMSAAPVTGGAREGDPQAVASQLFRLLTSRSFTYLTRKRCEPYRAKAEAYIRRSIEAGGPVSLFYDIGGGYRATLMPGRMPLSYTPGLGELLMLNQVRGFLDRARPWCPVPIRVHLVVDNLCALYVNAIPLASTEGYCRALREIIAYFGLRDIDLLVESERFAHADYERTFERALGDTPLPPDPSPSDHANAERFLGRRLTTDEAKHQIARYAAGGTATESALAAVVDGVRLTQRATPATLAFRSFPGADVRIQCGDVALGPGTQARIRPLLISSANHGRYRKDLVDVADWGIPHVSSIRLAY